MNIKVNHEMKLCVVGAGTAGLCSAKYGLECGMNVTVYEQASEVGGVWVYTDKIGKDEYGLDVHSSMYQGLHTNLPKEIMGYPDFPIPEQEKSYIPAGDMLEFLKNYSKHFHVTEHIKFLHHVVRICPKAEGWEVIVRNLPKNEYTTEYFDFVMVCNGHYHTPKNPSIPGMSRFKGKFCHSHDYRCPATFKDEKVLVIGAGPSGMDMAHEISSVAKHVVLSHHLTKKPKTIFPNNVIQKPDVAKILENGAEFIDKTNEQFTVIFFCTGYKYSFPFLSVDCEITVDENYVQPLYKHCININQPTMAFIGLPFYVCASQMMDLQARFVLKFFSKRKQLPSKEEMISDTEKEMSERWSKGYKKRQAHMMGPDQIKYYTDLSKTADIQNLKPVVTKIHNQSSERFLHDLINFRKDIFKVVDDENFIHINQKLN